MKLNKISDEEIMRLIKLKVSLSEIKRIKDTGEYT